MGENWNQHIGDDQLIYGLPKHMEAVAGGDKNAYWEIVPGNNACATCRSMRGLCFPKYPGPVHPNCNCEIAQVAPPERRRSVVVFGLLQNHEDSALERFEAGQKIIITLRGLGPLAAAARLHVDNTERRETRYLSFGQEQTFEFSKFGDTPMTWNVFFIILGGDGAALQYVIWS